MVDPYAPIRDAAADANHAIAAAGLVLLAFGNASAVDRERGVFAIKPSGIPCATVRPDQCVVVAIEDGAIVAGDLRPSSDEPTHRLLYQRLPRIGGIVHTHSAHATGWAQAGRPIPCLGTTHADFVRGEIPVTRALSDAETAADYEWNTGVAIAELYRPGGLDPVEVPAVLVRSHGPFTWGPSAMDAAVTAEAVETVARMAVYALIIEPSAMPIGGGLLARHFDRKHGANAYYGQTGATHGERDGG
jgi:L-ribulose-5-phosphate 4-epimerase